MFTKVEEIVFRYNGDGTKDVGVKFEYSDLTLLDIVYMFKKKYDVKYIDVSIDDEYGYGAGRHSLDYFFSMYDDLSMIEYVSFDLDVLNARVVVYPDNQTVCLNYRNVGETPVVELDQILLVD